MPGTYLAGKGAGVSVDGGGTFLAFRTWKCSMKAAALKINDFLSQGYQNVIAGFISGTLTLDGAYLAGGTSLGVGLTYTFQLNYSVALSLIVPAMISDITPNVEAEKEETISVTAESNGIFAAVVT